VVLNDCEVFREEESLRSPETTLVSIGGAGPADVSLDFSSAFYSFLAETWNYHVAFNRALRAIEEQSIVQLRHVAFYPQALPSADAPVGDRPEEDLLLQQRYIDVVKEPRLEPPSGSAHIDGGVSRSAPSPKSTTLEDGSLLYRVWFGTNRALVAEHAAERRFGPGYCDEISYGYCRVLIPKHHTLGWVGRFPWYKRLILGRRGRMQIRETAVMPADDFFAELHSSLHELPDSEKSLLLYIHGYNVSFVEAALRAAQLGADLKTPGETAFFSWPSSARAINYAGDIAAAEASEGMLAGFVEDLVQKSGAERLHVIAHSMGNRVLIRAIQSVAQRLLDDTRLRFGQIFLAAPDVDARVFTKLGRVYPSLSERTTLYISEQDFPLALSTTLHRYPRAGFKPPVTLVPKIDTVEVPKFDFDRLGHGYYAAARPILADMFTLMLRDLPPHRRQGISKRTDAVTKQEYWYMQR
jgi:esterase/lipase superfamily enzyme